MPPNRPAATTFDPEGDGYDYATARRVGGQPDDTGHWPSRDPRTGTILKGRSHPTWERTLAGEREAGNVVYRGADGRYYSHSPQKLEADAKRHLRFRTGQMEDFEAEAYQEQVRRGIITRPPPGRAADSLAGSVFGDEIPAEPRSGLFAPRRPGEPAGVGLEREAAPRPGFMTSVKSGQVDDIGTKVKIFAQGRFPDEPPEVREARYGIDRQGRIFYRDDFGQDHLETGRPELAAAIKDFAGREIVGRGPQIALETGGGIVGGLPGAMLGAVVGEGVRKGIGRFAFDEPQTGGEIAGDLAAEAALAGGGEVLSRLAPGAARRVVQGVTGTRQARRVALAFPEGLEPLDAATEARLRAIADRYEIDLTAPEAFQSPQLEQLFGHLATTGKTAQRAGKVKVRRQAEVERAAAQFFNEIAPPQGAFESGQNLVDVAREALQIPVTARTRAASPIYKQAFAEALPVDTGGALKAIDEAIDKAPDGELQSALRKVQKLMTRETLELPPPEGPGLRPDRPRQPTPEEPFPTVEAEAAALREQFQPGPVTVEASSSVKAGGLELTPEDRTILQGVLDTLGPDLADSDRLVIGKAINNRGLGPWDGVRVKQILEAGRQAADEEQGARGFLGDGAVPTAEGARVTPEPEIEPPEPRVRIRPGGEIPAQPIRRAELTPAQVKQQKKVRRPERRLETLQLAKIEIDDMVSGKHQAIAGATTSQKAAVERELLIAQKQLLDAMDASTPEGTFARGRRTFEEFSPPVTAAQKSLVGRVAKLEGDDVKNAHRRLLQSTWTDPATVKRARELMFRIPADPLTGRPSGKEAWQGAVRTYFEDIFETIKSPARTSEQTLAALAEQQPGRAKNLGRWFSNNAFGSQKQRQILRAAVPAQTYNNFKEFFELMDATGFLFWGNSTTAGQQEMQRQMKRAARTYGSKVVGTVTAPIGALRRMADAWDQVALGRFQEELVAALTTEQAARELRRIKRLTPRSEQQIQEITRFLILAAGADVARLPEEAFFRSRPTPRAPGEVQLPEEQDAREGRAERGTRGGRRALPPPQPSPSQ